MAILYVGAGGNDANDGLSWATRKLTINGAEDKPVAAGDTVYVGAGTYRESLTVDVAGTAGNPITYIGDYLGVNTDGVGGLVRVTGSNDDKTVSRASCVVMANARSNRTFRGFLFDSTSGITFDLQASSSNLIVDECVFQLGTSTASSVSIAGTGTNNVVKNSYFHSQGPAVQFTNGATTTSLSGFVDSCLIMSGGSSGGVRVDRVGGITVRNCTILAGENGVRVFTALAGGQTLTVNNCIIAGCNNALVATTIAEATEDYNNIYGNVVPRSNFPTGTHSNAYPQVFDARGFFEMMFRSTGPNSPTSLISLADLGSASQLINVSGTNPPATDLRGTGVIGGIREWGALEYDNTISTRARQGNMVGGGMVGN